MSSKRRPKSHSKSQRKKMKILNSQNFTMETIFDCFPTLSEDIFESLDEESLEKFVEKFHLNPAIRRTQGCILLTYLSVISSKFIQKFAQKCQYFTLIDQSVPLYNFYITFYLRTNQHWVWYRAVVIFANYRQTYNPLSKPWYFQRSRIFKANLIQRDQNTLDSRKNGFL